ncbi:hypothetical protein V6N13_092122 [Hibiscus sabdariffa]
MSLEGMGMSWMPSSQGNETVELFVSRAKFNPRTSFWRKLRQNHKFLAQNDESNEAKGSGSFEAKGKNVVNQNVCQQAESSSEESRRSLDTEQDIMYCSDCLCTGRFCKLQPV